VRLKVDDAALPIHPVDRDRHAGQARSRQQWEEYPPLLRVRILVQDIVHEALLVLAKRARNRRFNASPLGAATGQRGHQLHGLIGVHRHAVR
jgi:hypothetical protein